MNDQVDPFTTTWFPIAFPFLFVGMWLAITTMLGLLSGWFVLRSTYPDKSEDLLVRRRVQSASMGLGVHFNRVITIAACPSGLRVSANRLIAPFQPPFLVPWNEIEAEDARSFFEPVVRLRLGRPQIGRLTIGVRDWEAVRDGAGRSIATSGNLRTEPVANRPVGAALLLQWVIITVLAGTFFFLATRNVVLQGWKGPPLPALICYGFPAVAFGIPQAIRWFAQSR